MKRFFALFFFVIMLLFPVSVVLAGNDEDSGITESEEDAVERDDVGRISSGTITVNGRDSYIWGLSLYEASYNVVLSDGEGYLYITVGDDWGDYSKAYWSCELHLVGNYSLKVSTVTHYKDDSEHTSWDDTTSSSVPLSDTSYSLIFYNMNNEDFSKYFSFSSSIPIFKVTDEESINKYVNEGDYSGATNASDVDESNVKQDDSIELPKNLRTYGTLNYAASGVSGSMADKNTRVTVRWSPPSSIDTYSYDLDIKLNYSKIGSENDSTSWIRRVSSYPYEANNHYDLYTGEPAKRGSDEAEEFIIDHALISSLVPDFSWNVKSVEIRVRNIEGGKCSNWVSVIIHNGGGSYANVKDDDGNTVDDDYYNGQDVDNTDQNQTYPEDHPDITNNDGTVDFSVDGILDYIKSGFGLLGNGGLLALMSSTFSYIPASIWVLIKMAIAVSIAIMVLSLVKRFVFG